ncbi:prepilin-type N-terminal cleavage/methylation domain-containing protein [bacterium]|nr:prepilin-type N-terminal cleavage/methylation domain-containing protein [bacterium]
MKSASTLLSRAKQSGHTLVEVLIASSVSLLVITGALWVMFAGVKSSAQSTNTIVNDLTQWGIASRLWIDSRIANGITIYEDTQTINVERWLRAVVNDRGNFVVFSLSDTNGSGKTYYSRLSGYVFDSSQRKVFRFDYPVKASDQTGATPLEDILNNNRTDI